MAAYKFTVSNMNCDGCVKNIRSALEASEEIESIEIELNDQSVSVTSDLSEDAVFDIIYNAGYDAKPAKEKSGFFKRLIG